MKGKSLVIVAIVFGVVVVMMINAKIADLEKKANPPTTTFYRAIADIEPGETFGRILLGKSPLVEAVPSIPAAFAEAYPDALDELEVDRAKNEKILRPIQAGEFVRMSHFEPFTAVDLRKHLPKGHVAYAVKVSEETAVGYLLGPGDIVDIYRVTIEEDATSPGGQRAVSIKEANDVPIFAVQGMVDPTTGRTTGTKYRSVVLADTPEKITKVMAAAQLGELKLVLKSRAPGKE